MLVATQELPAHVAEALGQLPVSVDQLAAEPVEPDAAAADQLPVGITSDNLMAILQYAEAEPAALNDPETRALYEYAVTWKNEQDAATQKPAATVKPVIKADDGTTDTDTDTTVKPVRTVSAFNKDGAAEPNVSEVTDENFTEFVNSVFGVDTTKPDWKATLLESGKKFRADSQALPDALKKVEYYEETFTEMPIPLREATKAWLEGKEWKGIVTNLSQFDVDYTKTVDENKVEALIRYTFPDEQFTTDDFTADGLDDPKMKSMVKIARSKFAVDKQSIETQRADLLTKEQAKIDRAKTSVTSSVEALRKEFPSFGKSEINTIQSTLMQGKILDLFYNTDGSLKLDAAKKVGLAMYGEEAVKSEATIAGKKELSEANKTVVTSRPQTPKATPGTATQQQPAGTEALQQYASYMPNADPYSSKKRS